MLGDIFRPIIEPFTGAVGRALARAHLSPNTLTTIGGLGQLLVAWLILARHPLAAGIVLIPAVIVDVLDGAAARATGRVTKWGAYYDSVVDRVAEAALTLAVAWVARETQPRLVAASFAALVLSFLVSYARARAEGLGYDVPSGPGERAERAIILIVGLILGIVEAAMWTIAALAAWTFVLRCASVWRRAVRA